MPDFSYEELSAVLRVDNGKVIWKVSRGSMKAGQVAGRYNPRGYLVVMYKECGILAHRLVWLLTYGDWPAGMLDHANGVHDDNRIENLRIATPAQNAANAKTPCHNTSGAKGVLPAKNGKWMARIKDHKKLRHLGTFATFEDAKAAYVRAAKEIFGEFAYSERAK